MWQLVCSKAENIFHLRSLRAQLEQTLDNTERQLSRKTSECTLAEDRISSLEVSTVPVRTFILPQFYFTGGGGLILCTPGFLGQKFQPCGMLISAHHGKYCLIAIRIYDYRAGIMHSKILPNRGKPCLTVTYPFTTHAVR